MSVAAERLGESFRQAHPEIDWRGIRAGRNFIAHDYDGTDEEILWQTVAIQFPGIVEALTQSTDRPESRAR
nr:HepT-like ribonuclease domain-containing protein [Brooklawnia cerclae]